MNFSLSTVKAMGARNQADFFYVKDLQSRFIDANDNFLSYCGLSHVDQIYDKTDYDLPCHSYAHHYIRNDQDAMAVGEVQVIEPVVKYNGALQMVLTYKYPFIDENSEQRGVFGISKMINIDAVKKLMPLFDNNHRQLNIGNDLFNNKVNQFATTSLSLRELDVFYYILHGLGQKQVADRLGLSVRTVEDYVDHIKAKLGCANKYQLFEFAIHHGLMNIIPKHMLNEVV